MQNETSGDHTRLTIAAATVAAELHYAERTARQLTISAKNAAVLASRAGNQAAGLSVISNYYDELAGETIKLARTINQTAVTLSEITVQEWRTSATAFYLRKAYDLAVDATYRENIPPLTTLIEKELSNSERKFKRLLANLNQDLQEAQKYMRAIDVIAVTSRLEAQRTGEFKARLLQMANTIQAQTKEISAHINKSMCLLNQTDWR